MKLNPIIISLLSAAGLVVGCNKPADQTASDSAAATTTSMDRIAHDNQRATQDMKDYAYAQKTEFIEEMRRQSASIHADLDQLTAKVNKASDAAKAEAQPRLQALREQTSKLDQQIDAAKDATESTWTDVKSGLKKGYEGLKDGFQQSRQWVSDKIAP